MKRPKARANGEGSIYESPPGSGKWIAQVTRPDGRPARRRAATEAEALAKKTALLQALAAHVDTGRQPTLEAWCSTWLDTFADVKPGIKEDYRRVVRRYIAPHLGRIRLDKLTPAHVKRWMRTLEQEVSPGTVRNAYARLRTALQVACDMDYIARNVATKVDAPAPRPPQIRPLTLAQARQLLATVAGHRYAALYHLALALGLRQGELLGLLWADTDLKTRTLHVRGQLSRIGSKHQRTATTKTASGYRTLDLNDDLVRVLHAHWRNQQEERRIADTWHEQGLVFPSERGTPLLPTNLTKHFKRSLVGAGLPRIRFHDLRHTAASLLLASGIDPTTVSRVLGHSSPAITLKIYAHGYREQQAAAVDTLARALAGGQ